MLQPAVRSYTKDYRNKTAVQVVLSTLFFMWGLITVLNFMLIDELQSVFTMSPAEALLVNFIFFTTYFFTAIPAGKIINRYGYKNGIISGIVVAGFGCMLFYPAAEDRSYGTFVMSMFMVAAGITMLQVGANSYMVLLGRKERGASRLTLAQAFNSLGAFLAPLFAGGIFMRIAGITDEARLAMDTEEYLQATVRYVQLPYLLLGAVLFLLALFIGFSKLPRLVTENVEPIVKTHNGLQLKYIFQFPHVIMGGLAIFCYVGAEVTIGRFLANTSSDEILASIYWGGAMVGRFIGAAILVNFSPRKLIGISSIISAVLVAGFILTSSFLAVEQEALYLLAGVGLFNSILFPSIFAMAIDGLGKFSEEGSSFLIMSIVGGAMVPMIWGVLFDVSLAAAFILPIACYLYVSYFGFKGSIYEKSTNFY